MQFENLDISRLNHCSFRITASKTIYFDPFKIPDQEVKADVVFVSHEHFDHCSLEDISKVIKPETIIVTVPSCVSKAARLNVQNIIPINPGERKEVEDISVEAIPAYNINKFREPDLPFHPKEDGHVGFIVTLDSKRIYHAGDSDAIPEMLALTNIDVALIPVSGTYVMTPEEAAGAVNQFKPRLAIPMHYGEIVGTDQDAEKFKSLSQVPVEILPK